MTDLGRDEAQRLSERYRSVLERLERACRDAGRSRESVRLLAVSKFHPAAMLAAVAALGQRDFAENYVQEALEKRAELDAAGLCQSVTWHMIGHVQSRKAASVAGAFALVHTVDSAKLADALARRAKERGITQPVLLEINVGCEAQKSGIAAGEAEELSLHIAEHCPSLALEGLMCIPPVFDAGEGARPFFAALREIAERLRPRTGLALPELSMGMSGDFEWAVLEGATMVRIGTDIFGPRPPKAPKIAK